MATRKKADKAAREPARIGGKEVGRVLITGASAGIGAELAREFARHGHRLALVARRRSVLAELAAELEREHQVDVKIIAQDLGKPAGCAAAVRAAQAEGEAIDILVNNAGMIDVLPFVQAQPDKLAALVDLNVRALTDLTSRLLPGMVERGFGRVLNVASLAGFQPVPGMATYGASKAYVLSLTEALSEELRGSGVKITALCPGLTQTSMATEIKGQSAAARALPKQFVSDPRDVAAQAYQAMLRGQVVLVPGIANQVSAAWVQVTPRWVTRYVAGLAARQAG